LATFKLQRCSGRPGLPELTQRGEHKKVKRDENVEKYSRKFTKKLPVDLQKGGFTPKRFPSLVKSFLSKTQSKVFWNKKYPFEWFGFKIKKLISSQDNI